MSPKCARPRPRQRARSLKKSNAGANDRQIVVVPLGVARPLPPELLELADQIAHQFAARIRARGTR